MNTKKIAIASTLGAFAVMALLLVYPVMASSAGSPAATGGARVQLSTGQTITLTSVAGRYWEVGDRAVNGTASGTMTLQVSVAFRAGYSLTVTGGSLDINGTTYTISGGSALLGPYGAHLLGQGQAGTAQFLFGGRDLGTFGGTNHAIFHVDLKDGSSEFVARLLVNVSA